MGKGQECSEYYQPIPDKERITNKCVDCEYYTTGVNDDDGVCHYYPPQVVLCSGTSTVHRSQCFTSLQPTTSKCNFCSKFQMKDELKDKQ